MPPPFWNEGLRWQKEDGAKLPLSWKYKVKTSHLYKKMPGEEDALGGTF